jgi:hypothetical protein
MVFVKPLRADSRCRVFIEGAVLKHSEENMGTAPCQGTDRLVLAFTLGTLAVVVRPRRMMQGGEC